MGITWKKHRHLAQGSSKAVKTKNTTPTAQKSAPAKKGPGRPKKASAQ